MGDRGWERLGAAGGIAWVVLQMVAQSLIQVGGQEPAFSAGQDEIVQFFANRDPALAQIGGVMAMLSMVALLFFLGSLWAALRRAEGEPGWLSLVAFASGAAAVAAFLSGGGWELALFRLDEGLDGAMAQMLFDEGNLTFANTWVAFAGMLLAAGVVGVRKGALPGWLSWAGVLIGVGLLAARAVWASSGAVFAPWVLFWVWLIAASVVLMRRAGRAAA